MKLNFLSPLLRLNIIFLIGRIIVTTFTPLKNFFVPFEGGVGGTFGTEEALAKAERRLCLAKPVLPAKVPPTNRDT